KSVKHAVDQVTECSGEDQPGAENITRMIILLKKEPDIIHAENNGYQTEQGKGHLAHIASEFPSPCHTFIFNEEKLEFFANYVYAVIVRRDGRTVESVPGMTQRHVRLYPDFQSLI